MKSLTPILKHAVQMHKVFKFASLAVKALERPSHKVCVCLSLCVFSFADV